MNRCFHCLVLLAVSIFAACQHNAPDQSAQVFQEEAIPDTIKSGSRQYAIDTDRSLVKWKGTKLNYTGKHEGTVDVGRGSLYFEKERLTGGTVVIDMKRIKVTDIPPHETVPIRNLTRHLNSDFDTKNYPVAKFEITGVNYLTEDQLTIRGNLTIKDVTKNIEIRAKQMKNGGTGFATHFVFNRFDWNIGTNGSWLEKRVVDKEVELTIKIICNI